MKFGGTCPRCKRTLVARSLEELKRIGAEHQKRCAEKADKEARAAAADAAQGKLFP